MAKKPPRWYFSFRSPYSWLAYRDLLRLHSDIATVIEWHPFWEPDPSMHNRLTDAGGTFPYVPMSREKHHYILQDVRKLAKDRGLAVSWPVDRAPRWEVAHLGYLIATDRGVGREYVAEVYRARWELGLDISDPLTIASVAENLGVDPRGLANAADDPETRERGVAALMNVSFDGVFGVPFFACGFDKFWGLDRLHGFVEAMRGDVAVARDRRVRTVDETPVLASAGDFGHGGGCG